VVSFGHRSVFPVMFDAESIEKWWTSSLVFKVYCKLPAQKMVIFVFFLLLPSVKIVKTITENNPVYCRSDTSLLLKIAYVVKLSVSYKFVKSFIDISCWLH